MRNHESVSNMRKPSSRGEVQFDQLRFDTLDWLGAEDDFVKRNLGKKRPHLVPVDDAECLRAIRGREQEVFLLPTALADHGKSPIPPRSHRLIALSLAETVPSTCRGVLSGDIEGGRVRLPA